MSPFSGREAGTHLPRLIEKAVAGEEVVSARNNEPVVRMISAHAKPRKTLRIGALKGRVSLDERFEPLALKEIAAWESD